MKKILFIGNILLVLFLLEGCSTQIPETKELNIKQSIKKPLIDLDLIAQNMITNTKIRKFLCPAVEPSCEDIFIYKWQKIGDDDIIAFVSKKQPVEWQNDPFKFSPLRFKVNLKNGDVYQISAHDRSFSLITNINN
jgi:hypothetical protein